MLNRAAKAMNCKLIYAIVPLDEHDSLESIVDIRSKKAAKDLLQKVRTFNAARGSRVTKFEVRI